MINNFSNTEKSLKRYLKEKVTITTATVVSFLIAGTVTMAAGSFNGTNAVTVKFDSGIKIEQTDATADTTISDSKMATYGNSAAVGSILDYNDSNEETLTLKGDGGFTFGDTGQTAGGTFITFDKTKGKLVLSTNTKVVGVASKESTLIAAEEGQALTVDVNTGKTLEVGADAIGVEAKGATVALTGDGTFKVNGTSAIGIKLADGAKAEIADGSKLDLTQGTGVVVTSGKGTVTINNNDVTVGANAVGAEAAAGTTVTLAGTSKFDVDQGTGIKVLAPVVSTAANESEVKTTTIALGTTGLKVTDGTGIDVAAGANALVGGKLEIGTGNKVGIKVGKGAILTLGADANVVGGSTKAIETTGAAEVTLEEGATLVGTLAYTANKEVEGTINAGELKAGTKVTVTAAQGDAADNRAKKITVNATSGTDTVVGAISVAGGQYADVAVNVAGNVKAAGLVAANGAANGVITVAMAEDGVIETSGKLLNVATAGGDIVADLSKGATVKGTVTDGASTILLGDVTVAENGKLADLSSASSATTITLTGAEQNELTITNKGIGLQGNSKAVSTLNIEEGANVEVKAGGTLLAGSDKADVLSNKGVITLENVDDGVAKAGDSGAKSVSKLVSGTGTAVVTNYGIITLGNYNGEKDPSKVTLTTITQYLKDEGVLGASVAELKGLGIFEDGQGNTIYAGGEHINADVSINDLAATTEPEKGFTFVKGANSSIQVTGDGTVEDTQYNVLTQVKFTGVATLDNSDSDKAMIIKSENNDDGYVEGGVTFAKTGSSYLGKVIVNGEGNKANNGQYTAAAITFGNEKGTAAEGYTFAGILENDTDRTSIAITNGAGYATTLTLGAEIDVPTEERAAAQKEYMDTVVNGTIEGTLNSNSLVHNIETKGNVTINGTVKNVASITAGTGTIADADQQLVFGEDAKIVSTATAGASQQTALKVANNGTIGIQIGDKGNNLFANSKIDGSVDKKNNGIDVSNLGEKSVEIMTDYLTSDTTLDLGGYQFTSGTLFIDSNFYGIVKEGDKYVIKYGEGLSEDDYILLERNPELYNAFFASQNIHDLLGGDNVSVSQRLDQVDELVNNNIFSETVKMSMDTLRMNEDAVLSLSARPEAGKWAAAGKALYSNSDYDREGSRGDYNVDTENTGLMGAVEYGLSDSSSVGFAFSGVKQDLDMGSADADGDAFYFGAYRKDNFKNIELTTGLGYQLNSIDANHITGSDDFDSNAFSGYVQGKYNVAVNDSTTVSPVARLAVTRFNQDSIDTGRMTMDEVEGTYADMDFGVEVAKRYIAEKGTTKLLAAVTYTHTLGDVNDDYKVKFINRQGQASDAVTVKGAELGENTLRLNLGADYEHVNGFMVNGGVSYEFDDNDRDSVGITLGAGYKF